MKNKEIEELLNKLRNTADTSFFAVCGSEEELDKMPKSVCKFLSLNNKQAKLLLSHIEQLEKRNKQLYEGFMATQEELTDYAMENEQLQNNRNKAIEVIDLMTPELWNISNAMTYKLKDIKYILKGDSDDK